MEGTLRGPGDRSLLISYPRDLRAESQTDCTLAFRRQQEEQTNLTPAGNLCQATSPDTFDAELAGRQQARAWFAALTH